jgi:hypothetical protein
MTYAKRAVIGMITHHLRAAAYGSTSSHVPSDVRCQGVLEPPGAPTGSPMSCRQSNIVTRSALADVGDDSVPAPLPSELDQQGTVVDLTNAIDALTALLVRPAWSCPHCGPAPMASNPPLSHDARKGFCPHATLADTRVKPQSNAPAATVRFSHRQLTSSTRYAARADSLPKHTTSTSITIASLRLVVTVAREELTSI